MFFISFQRLYNSSTYSCSRNSYTTFIMVYILHTSSVFLLILFSLFLNYHLPSTTGYTTKKKNLLFFFLQFASQFTHHSCHWISTTTSSHTSYFLFTFTAFTTFTCFIRCFFSCSFFVLF